jgi:hypothetical protein
VYTANVIAECLYAQADQEEIVAHKITSECLDKTEKFSVISHKIEIFTKEELQKDGTFVPYGKMALHHGSH